MSRFQFATRLLVSIRSVREAKSVQDLPVGILDVKEPRRGSLGCPTAQTLQRIQRLLDSRHTLSAALGELVDRPAVNRWGVSLAGYHFAKLGLAGAARLGDWRAAWRACLDQLPPQIIPVAVSYADWRHCDAPPPAEVLAAAAELRCGGWLIDTYDKTAGDVFHWMSDSELSDWIAAAHRHEMLIALAGSLTFETLPRCVGLGPDIIGLRGAVCRGRRHQDISPDDVVRAVEVLEALGSSARAAQS